MVKEIPNAHDKKVRTFALLDERVCSGGDDSYINIWSSKVFIGFENEINLYRHLLY